jgi:hypothetical protein
MASVTVTKVENGIIITREDIHKMWVIEDSGYSSGIGSKVIEALNYKPKEEITNAET